MSDNDTAYDGGENLDPAVFLAEVTNDVPTDSVAAANRDAGLSVVHPNGDAVAETARALLDAAEAAGLPAETVRTSDGAFIVPTEVADAAELPEDTQVVEGQSAVQIGFGSAVVRTPGGDDDREPRTSPDSPNAALQPPVVNGTDDDGDEHSQTPNKSATKAELRAWADQHGVQVDEDATVAELREAIDQHAARPRPTA